MPVHIQNYNFDPNKVISDLIQWLRDWYEQNGNGAKLIIGISGGKDSSTAAALAVKAFGKEKVLGVLMPNGEQSDIGYSHMLCEHLGIENRTINIGPTFQAMKTSIWEEYDWGADAEINAPARIRMAFLYAVAQSTPGGGRVINTCNLSEDWVGYATRWGDSVGDVSPLSQLTVTEIKKIGYELGLPKELIEKTPSDGLCGKTDEDRLGFAYADLDNFIRTGTPMPTHDQTVRVERLHKVNLFKMKDIPRFCPHLPIVPDDDVFHTDGIYIR